MGVIRIQLIEPDPVAEHHITVMLEHVGFEVNPEGPPDFTIAEFEPAIELLSSKQIPLLVLSSRTDVEAKIKSFGFGAIDYLEKPFHREELLARINSHVSRI